MSARRVSIIVYRAIGHTPSYAILTSMCDNSLDPSNWKITLALKHLKQHLYIMQIARLMNYTISPQIDKWRIQVQIVDCYLNPYYLSIVIYYTQLLAK